MSQIKTRDRAANSSMAAFLIYTGSGPQNSIAAEPPRSKVEGVQELSNLRSHSGGYLKPPNHRRVFTFVNGIFGDAVSGLRRNSSVKVLDIRPIEGLLKNPVTKRRISA